MNVKSLYLKNAEKFLKNKKLFNLSKEEINIDKIRISNKVTDLSGLGIEYLTAGGEIIAKFINGNMQTSEKRPDFSDHIWIEKTKTTI